jgi:PEP-CTERM motif
MKTIRGTSKCVLLVSAVAVSLLGTRVYADTAANIIQFYSQADAALYDNASGNYPVVTAIGSQPGTFGGRTYTGWSVFAEDITGSLDLFISGATLTQLTGNAGASISVGDALDLSGSVSPFQLIPELAFSTVPASNHYFNTVSTGNAVPTPPVLTISQINTIAAISNNPAISGKIIEIKNVTITDTGGNGLTALPGNGATVAQESFTMSDDTGSVLFFDWITSYSAAILLEGTPIGPGLQYDMIGFTHAFGETPEFTAISLTLVPEPSTVALVATGLLGLLAIRRRRS